MSSFPSSSLIKAARGIPLIATPTIESASICRFPSSSRAMSDIAAAMNPMRFPYTPTDRQPIFTSFGASPPLIPRVKSQVTVSGDRCNSSAISFSERPFSLYSMALFPPVEVDRLVERHLARVQVDVDQDPASPPDLVEELHEFRLWVGAESGLLHHVLAVVRPALDRLRRVREDARVRRVQARAGELQMMPGVSFVDRGVPDARERMLPEHLRFVLDRRHHVESLFVRLEPRRRVVRRERDHVPQVRGRLDDRELLVRRNRREVVLADERLRVRHRLRRIRERLLEARGMVGLHDLFRFLDRGARLDLFRDAHERSLAFAKIPLADGVDLLHGQSELAEP